MAEDTVKISANLPQGTYDLMRWIASERGTTLTEVLRRAVQHEAFILDVQKEGGKLLTEDGNGRINQVVIR